MLKVDVKKFSKLKLTFSGNKFDEQVLMENNLT